MSCGSARARTTPVCPSSTTRRHRADRIGDHRAPGHLRFDHDAGDAFGRAGEQQQVERTEHRLDIRAVAEQMHERGERQLARVGDECGLERTGAGDDEMRVRPGRAHACEHVERAFRSLLFDQVADETEQRRFGRERQFGAQLLARGGAVHGDEAFRVAEVRNRPHRPGEPERAQFMLHLGGERDRGVEAPAHDVPPAGAQAPRHAVREVEDALPDHRRAMPRAGQRDHLRGPTAVREHDIGLQLAHAAAQLPHARHERDRIHRDAAHERGERRIGPAVERGRAREHDVRVAQRVECGREIERHELCTAALAAADEVQDAHRLHRAMPGQDTRTRG